jgi:hypothetical protein
MGDNTEMGTLAVTEGLHAKQQKAARKEAERAARKAPQDAAADAKGEAGHQRPKRVRPPGVVVLQVNPQSAAERAGLKPGDLVKELDGTPVRDAADLQLRLALLRITMRSKSFFFVPSNDLPETFRGGQTGCPVVVGVGDVGMGMMQKRAAEIGVLAAASGDGGGGGGAEQMRAHSHTHRREGGHYDHTPHLYIAQGRAVG